MDSVDAVERAKLLSTFANPKRLLMLKIMLDEEVSVGTLAERVGLSQSATSQHLALLKRNGLMVQKREMTSRYCSITADMHSLVRSLIETAESKQTTLMVVRVLAQSLA
ncbi:metalloregulator ArsR/SmtB family transcription factor [Rhizobium sp. PP-F2F-G48]|uniref:ArsR/SmtB family transcription factor n=1 Tax=Rhizobium sp. PP-F2F-G48 TaxID=2135651 RepID=UPI001045F4DE|nr:metalloregulator ArsR/SmtB family transcription factor [Rhizobium sp. PP-F2F-G48]